MQSIVLILSIATCIFAVKPLWRTPVTNVRKNATSRTQRASNSVPPSEGFPGNAGQKQVPYYTRPEDFKIPDYRPAKPNAFQQNFQQNFPPNVQQNFRPNFQQNVQQPFFPNGRFVPQQFIPQQFAPNFRVPNQGNGFVNQPPLNQGYRNGPQYPNGFFQPPHPGYPINNGRNQWYIPQNAHPYLVGPGPLPPQGVYGPSTTTGLTVPPMIPSANPHNYQGTFPTQPSVNPELVTASVDSQPPTEMQGQTTRGWYNPTSMVTRGYVETDAPGTQGSTHTSSDTPRTSESKASLSTKSSTLTASSASATESTRPSADEDFLRYVFSKGPLPPPLSSPATTSSTKSSTLLAFSASTTESTRPSADEDFLRNVFSKGPVPPSLSSPATTSSRPLSSSLKSSEQPVTTPEYPEELYGRTDEFVEEAVTQTGTPKDNAQATSTFIPRPPSSQILQPPGHLPEDFSEHIDVNFLKPNRSSCVGPLCGIDVDKVSLYNPETAENGRRPTLLISNAAKGDAARLGYAPPPPKPISEFESVPPEYTKTPLYPGYRPEPVPPVRITTTEEPFHLEVPTKGPHVFMPPQNFPAPSSPTLIPRLPAYETTSQPTYSPTAKTLPTEAPPEVPFEAATTVRHFISESTTAPSHVPPPFETTPQRGETFTETTTTQPPSTENPNPYESETTIPAWSPTYKTVPTRPSSTIATSTSRRPYETPPTSIARFETSTTTYVSVEVTPLQTTKLPTTQAATEQPHRIPLSTSQETVTPSREVPTPSSRAPPSPAEFPTSPSEEVPTTPSRESITPPFGGTPATSSEMLTPFSEASTTTTSPRESPTTPIKIGFPPGETIATPTGTHTTGFGGPPTAPTTEFPASPFEGTPTPPKHYTTLGFPSETPPAEFPTTPLQGHPVSTTVRSNVPNRVRGKVHVICKEDGIEFTATTLFPFTGQIFANERKRVSSCVYNLVNSANPMVFLPFAECGVKNAGDQKDSRAQYHMQVVMVIQQSDGTSTIQSFMAQCVHQKIHYNKQTLPRRIEEALEELKLIATKLEQKAPLPQVEMKIVVDEHHQHGPEVSEVDIGMPLAVQWKLNPESDAYGFHVKNCIVRDDISGIEHKMIDELGCSTDLSIFAHPHYDTYHDMASSHLWAFKVPDHTRLRIRCDVAICSDIPSSTTNISSCASIPSPPFCPDLITSPSNSILYDAEGAFLKRRRQAGDGETQTVRAALCTGDECDSPTLGLDKRCFDLYWVAASTGFSFAALIAAISIHIGVRVKIARQYR